MNKLEGGLRLKGKSKKKQLITIVTVVRNGEKTLERTIKSVINQTARKNIEYIIIDGASTDKTLDIIKKYNDKIDYWMSEPDKGIYDAMNKGVLLAKGEYIQFIGADDFFISTFSIRNILKNFNKKADIFSYRIAMTSDNIIWNYFPGNKINLVNIKKGKTLAHPATFVKKRIFEEVGFFNLDYHISADYDFICKCFLNNYKIIQDEKAIINFDIGGVSSKNNFKRSLESTIIIIKNFNIFYGFRYFVVNFIPALIQRIFFSFGILKYYMQLKQRLSKQF